MGEKQYSTIFWKIKRSDSDLSDLRDLLSERVGGKTMISSKIENRGKQASEFKLDENEISLPVGVPCFVMEKISPIDSKISLGSAY